MVRITLQTKMTLAVFVLVVGIASLAGILSLQHFERTLKDTISHQQFTLITAVARDLDAELARSRQVIIDIAATIPSDLLDDPDRIQHFLNQHLGVAATSLFDNGIFLFGADGRMIAEYPDKNRRGRDYSFRDYFRRTVASGQPQISDPYFSSQSHNHPAVNFTVPLRDRHGRLVGVLAGSVDLTQENFLGGISRTTIGRSGYLYLYNRQRLMIMHPDPTRILQRDVPPGANLLFDRAIEGFEGTGETVNSRGVPMLASFKRLPTSDWIMAGTFPLEEAYTPVYRARRIFVLGLAGVLILSTLSVWFLMGHLTAPLHLLLGHIRDLSKNGGARRPLPIRTGDEVGALADSFNELMTEVEEQKRISEREREFSHDLLQNSAVPCFVLDRHHRVLTWTCACEELTGIPAAEVVGTDRHWKAFFPEQRPTLADLVLDGNLEQTLDLYERFSESPLIREGVQAQGWSPNIGGRLRYLLSEAAPIRDSGGEIIAAIETLHDLTGLKRAEEALRESEQSYRSLIERSPDAIIVHRDGNIVFVNQAAARLFAAQSPAQLAGRRMIDLIDHHCRQTVERRFRDMETRQIEQPYAEEKIRRLNGTTVEVEAGSTPVFYGGKWGVQTILRDITDRKELQERIWRQANFDTLTGIPNRLMFHDRLQMAMDQAERENFHLALFFIDLDQFKEVNDHLGHAAGDDLLRAAAQRLAGVLRKSDTLARMGGDEFTVIMPRINEPPMVSTVARRILDALTEPFPLPGGEGRISASIGIAFYPEDGADMATLMRHADMAMYRAKESGRNTFTFYSAGRIIRDPNGEADHSHGNQDPRPQERRGNLP